MGFTYTDYDKVVLEATQKFRVTLLEAVEAGDLLSWYNSDNAYAVQFADQSDSQRADCIAMEAGAAGDEIWATRRAELQAVYSGNDRQYFGASSDYFGAPLYLGESGKPSSTLGTKMAQVIGHLLARDRILLDCDFDDAITDEIYVSKDGKDDWSGSERRPLLTLTQAFSTIGSTRNKVMVRPGDYEEATTLTFPAYNCSVAGIGGDGWGHGFNLLTPTDDATTMKINHIVDGSRVIGMKNFSIECNEEVAGVYPLHIVKTGTAKLYLTMDHVVTEQDTDYSGMYVDFSGTSDKGNIWLNDCLIGGKITCVFGNASDRLWFRKCTNLDGTYTSGAYAAVIIMENCIVKPTYVVVGAAQNVVHLASCVGMTGNETFAAITESGSLSGVSANSTVVCPAAV